MFYDILFTVIHLNRKSMAIKKEIEGTFTVKGIRKIAKEVTKSAQTN